MRIVLIHELLNLFILLNLFHKIGEKRVRVRRGRRPPGHEQRTRGAGSHSSPENRRVLNCTSTGEF